MPADPEHIRAVRRKAEKVLSEVPEKRALTFRKDLEKCFHELSGYQARLETQNEELRRSREELEESRRVYAELYDFAPVGYLTLNKAGIITGANLTACALLGVERTLLVKNPFSRFVSLESQDPFHLHRQQVLETTTLQTCQLVVKRRGGTVFDARMESVAVQVDGELSVRSILTDITDRKVEEVQFHYELLFQNSRDIVLLVRRGDRKILEANAAAASAYGYSRDELLNLSISDLWAKDAGMTPDQLAQAEAEGLLFETIHRRKDGSTFPVEVSSRGTAVAGTRTLISVIRDITKRRRAEEALRESHERLRVLAEATFEGIGFSEEGRILEVNDQLARMLGYEKDELIGMEISSMVFPEDRPRVLENIRKNRESVIEHRFVRKDGTVMTAEVHGKPFMYEGREIRVTALQDITERKKTEQALYKAHGELELRVEERTEELRGAYENLKKETKERERAEAQLRQAQKMEALGTLAGGVAHDFNNMLAAIIGFSEIALDRIPAESGVQRQLQRILQAGLRGRDLVKQMLTFSRTTEQEKKPVLLSSIVKESVRLLRASIPQTISMRTNVKSESSLILGDAVQIQQIIMNLCTNAAHAMREKGGTLDIELCDHSVSPSTENPHGIKPGLYMKLIVSDTGTGISPDIMDKIFDPFFTTKKLGEGTGLGLSVVHGIVKQSSGYVTVESVPNQGSAFTVYLPKVMGGLRADAVNDDTLPTGRERILFVDDEEALVEMGEELLEELGYDVTCILNSRQALALFRLDPSQFDLVISDQTMPEMTGVELAREILAIRADMPIIMCTGYSHRVDAATAEVAGIKAFAMKPLTKKEIARTIREVLRR
jgi:PAS domain S-box-containing protein